MDFLFGNNFLMNEKTLDFLWARQTVIASNLSNAETPNYKSRYLTFEDELKSKLESTQKNETKNYREAINNANMHLHVSDSETTRADGNNVQTDVESTELARTGLQYQFALQAYKSDITRLKTVIKGQ